MATSIRLVLTGAVCLIVLLRLAASAQASAVVELPVAFSVVNTNTSQLSCSSDGATYTVRGHLTGPSSALDASGPRAVTLYNYGFESGEWQWRFRDVPGYDYAAEMARLGHVSVTIDPLGHGQSGHPDGLQSCMGSQADVTHQIIGQLRTAAYSIEGARPVAFSKVVSAGHDIGGAVAQIEAFSYRDIDGLMLWSWQDQGQTPFLLSLVADGNGRCTTGGESAFAGGPGNYFHIVVKREDWTQIFANSEPAVIDRAWDLRLRDPCAYLNSSFQAVLNEAPRLSEISVPVLLVHGDRDPTSTRDGWDQQKGHFSGSKDVTAVAMAGTGHYQMLDRNAPQFRALVAEWLRSRGYLSAGARASAPTRTAAGCAKAPGRITSTGLGAARLGATPEVIRRSFGRDTDGRSAIDRFCLAGGGTLRIGYLTDAQLRRARGAATRRNHRRAVLILSNRTNYKTGLGVGVGSRRSAARKGVGRAGFGVRLGANTWYVRPGKYSSLLFEVTGNRVREVGVASRSLTGNAVAAERFLRRFER